MRGYETVDLEWRQVGARAVLPPGLYHVRADVHLDHLRDQLAASITAHVLTEPGGVAVEDTDTRTETADYLEHVRPRWLPRFLWRRVPTVPRTVTVTARAHARARPLWTYPHSTVRVPRLGDPRVMIAVESGRETYDVYADRLADIADLSRPLPRW